MESTKAINRKNDQELQPCKTVFVDSLPVRPFRGRTHFLEEEGLERANPVIQDANLYQHDPWNLTGLVHLFKGLRFLLPLG